MNPIKGAGAVLFVALVFVLLSGVSDVSDLILAVSAGVVVVSLVTFAASVRRKRHDRRVAGGRAAARP